MEGPIENEELVAQNPNISIDVGRHPEYDDESGKYILKEPLVKTPPDKETRVFINVPVCEEFQDGSLLRLLGSLAEQSADKNKFEVLVLINNVPEAKKNNTKLYQDNTKMIVFLDKMRSPDFNIDQVAESFDLNQIQKETVGRIIESGLRVRSIDFTGGIKGDSNEQRAIGLVRNMLEQETSFRDIEVCKMRGESPSDARNINDKLDADCVVGRDYVARLIEHYDSEAKPEALMKEHIVFPRLGPEQKTPFLLSAVALFNNYELFCAVVNDRSVATSAAISSRVQTSRYIPTKQINWQEDWHLANDLGYLATRGSGILVAGEFRAKVSGYESSQKVGLEQDDIKDMNDDMLAMAIVWDLALRGDFDRPEEILNLLEEYFPLLEDYKIDTSNVSDPHNLWLLVRNTLTSSESKDTSLKFTNDLAEKVIGRLDQKLISYFREKKSQLVKINGETMNALSWIYRRSKGATESTPESIFARSIADNYFSDEKFASLIDSTAILASSEEDFLDRCNGSGINSWLTYSDDSVMGVAFSETLMKFSSELYRSDASRMKKIVIKGIFADPWKNIKVKE